MSLKIESNIRDYDVYFEGVWEFLDELARGQNFALVIDKNVFKIYEAKFRSFDSKDIFIFDAIEENKTYKSVCEIYDFLIGKAAKRNLTFVSIGGGITQDVSGFVASTLYRGLKWIFIPTTFLAITDSCIGSKTSLNYGSYKNLIGTFYPPQKIYINTDFLDTLTELDFYSGLGECIKFQLMQEVYPKNFDLISETIRNLATKKECRVSVIKENMKIKLGYMLGDEFDLGRRNMLNYGHCFGHALETSSKYFVPHGIAVTIGVIFANAIALMRKLINSNLFDYINKNILLPYIPLKLCEAHMDAKILLQAMKNDKKRIGDFLTVIIPDSEFKMTKVADVTDEEFFTALDITKSILIKE